MATTTGPVEPKVTAASIGAALSGLALWLLGAYVFGDGVPDVVAAVVALVVPAAVSFVAGWTRTTPRPVLAERLASAPQERG